MKFGIEEVRFRHIEGNYFKKIAEFGFEAAEYSLYDINDEIYTLSEEERRVKLLSIAEMARKAKIEISQVHGPAHSQIDDKTAKGRAKRVEITKTAIRACSYLGSENLVVHTFMSKGEDDALKAEEVFALNKELLSLLADYAADFGVTLCIENMRQEKLSLGDPKEVVRLIDEIGKENVKMCFDIGHAIIFSKKIPLGDAIKLAGDRIACTHLHDNYGWVDVHLLPTVGAINWDEVCAAFNEIKFDGTLSIDSSPNPKLPYELFSAHAIIYGKVANLLKEKFSV